MSDAPPPCCACCRFWQAFPNQEERGRCRRQPPTVLYPSGTAWPEALATDWCGEWEAAD